MPKQWEKLDWVRAEQRRTHRLVRLVQARDARLPCLRSRTALEALVRCSPSMRGQSPALLCSALLPPLVRSFVLPRIVQLLPPEALVSLRNGSLSMYLFSTLSGLVISVGGLSESVVKSASEGLLHWCREVSTSRDFNVLSMLSSTLLELLPANEKVDCIVLPTLRTTNLLLRNDYLECLF